MPVMVILIFCLALISLACFLLAVKGRDGASNQHRSASQAPDFAPRSLEQDVARKQRVFLHVYPEWANRDFRSDPSSPWFTDPRFAAAERSSRRSRQVKIDLDSLGPNSDPITSKFDVWR